MGTSCEVVTRRGLVVRRVVNHRPSVARGGDGKAGITFPFDAKTKGPGLEFWLALGLVEAEQLNAGSAPAGSAFERDRGRVEVALAFVRHLVAQKKAELSEIARIMEDAKTHGYLTEAIFIHLLDRRTAPEYVKFRESSPDRLIDYIKTHVVVSGRPKSERTRPQEASAARL